MKSVEKFKNAKYLFLFSKMIEEADTYLINTHLSESMNFEYIAYQTVLVDPTHLLDDVFGSYSELSNFTASHSKIFRNKDYFEEYSNKLNLLKYQEKISGKSL